MTIRNQFKVTKRTWNKWSRQQRLVFNETYAYARRNQKVFNAFPGEIQLSKQGWETVCWNIAWTAAQCVVTLE